MKIERLRKSHRKEIIIGAVLTVVIGGALTFRLTHSKYRFTQSIDLAEGVIHYKAPDFKVMAMYQQKENQTCTGDSCYDELTGRMPSSGYVVNEKKSYCTLDGKEDTEAKLYTENSKHIFENLTKSNKCYLYFDKQVLAADVILANVTINEGTPTFSQTATTNEGVYQTNDGMYDGTTYYWRGAVENNYVKFAGFCWRIIRINGDGTIRLIYDGTTCHANGEKTAESIAVTNQKYNTISDSNQSNYVGWTYDGTNQRTTSGTASNAKTQLDSWFTNNLVDYTSKIADGKFCNNRNTESGSWAISGRQFNYEEYININSSTPTTSCPNGDIYTLKIGVITVSEVMFAGGTTADNTSYYLYSGQAYWTMSPAFWNSAPYVYALRYGNIEAFPKAYEPGLRPVINLKSDVTFSSGDGLKDSPYIVAN